MSASAVAARAVSLSVSNMDEEEQEPQQLQKCEELTEELEMDKPQQQQQQSSSLDLDEEKMVLEEQRLLAAAQESEAENERLQVDAQLRAMAVSATTRTATAGPRTNAAARAHHDAAPSTATSTGTRSAGESLDDVNGKDRLKPFIRTCKKFESGSGSGDQDGMVSMEDGTDVAAKKRKTRRGKPKHRKLKPYSKQQPSYQQRLRCRASGRPNKAGRNPAAPYNTTQFLMEDRGLPDLDEKIAGTMLAPLTPADLVAGKPTVPPRTRDSSFSIDSDEEYFYSSPEDEEEFLSLEFSKEFSNVYEERLSALSKAQLIAEYIQLEAKVDGLTKRLRAKNSASSTAQPQQQQQSAAGAPEPNEPRDAELARKLKAVQQRVEELVQQNEQLRRENELLRQRHGSPMSSVDSESDSSSSSHGSDCSDCNHKTSPGSSPVPASYHACNREKSSRRKNSSVSSVASETDSTTNDSAASSPKSNNAIATSTATTPTATKTATTTAAAAAAAAATTSNGATEVANGHAASYEIVNLPT